MSKLAVSLILNMLLKLFQNVSLKPTSNPICLLNCTPETSSRSLAATSPPSHHVSPDAHCSLSPEPDPGRRPAAARPLLNQITMKDIDGKLNLAPRQKWVGAK